MGGGVTEPPGPDGRREPVEATTIDRLVDGIYPAMALLAGLQLDLFSVIAAGASTCGEIAAAVEGDAPKTRLLLDALVAAGLLEKASGRYSVTDEAHDHLVSSSPWSRQAGHHVLATLWSAALHSAESVRTGRAAQPQNYSALAEDEAESFLRGLTSDAASIARRCLDVVDIRPGQRVVDIGGGGGGAAMAFVDAAPQVTATVVELANIANASRTIIDSAGYRDRVQVVTADATEEVPGEHDVAWVSLVTQTLDPNGAEALISNASRALSPSGTLHLVNVVVDTSRVRPPRAALFNTALLNLYDGGQAYTVADYERWLRSAGLSSIRWTPLNDMVRLVSARRA